MNAISTLNIRLWLFFLAAKLSPSLRAKLADKLLNLANHLFEKAEYDSARHIANVLSTVLPTESRSAILLAELYTKMLDHAAAETAWRTALEADPGSLYVRYSLARSLFQQKRLEESERLLENLATDQPGHTATLSLLAEISENRNNPAAAEARWRAALDSDPGNLYVRYSLARSLFQQERLEEIERLLESVSAADPPYPPALALLAEITSKRGDFAGAESYWRKALDAEPDNFSVRFRLAWTLFQQNRFEESELLLESLISSGPPYPPALALLAEITSKRGDFAGAELYWRKALDAEPDSFSVRLGLATTLFHRQRFGEAKDLLDSLITIHPNSNAAIALLAQTCESLGQFREAEIFWTRLTRLDPGDLWSLSGVCRVMIKQGNESHLAAWIETTRQNLCASLEKDQSNPQTLAGLGHIAVLAGQPTKAVQYYRSAIALDNCNPRIVSHLASVLDEIGLHGEALRVYRRSALLTPCDQHVLLQLARLCDRAGKHKRAAVFWNAAVVLDRNWESLTGSAENAVFRGCPEIARELIREANELNPRSPILYMLSRSLSAPRSDYSPPRAGTFVSPPFPPAFPDLSPPPEYTTAFPVLRPLLADLRKARMQARKLRSLKHSTEYPKVSLICLIHRREDLRNAALQLSRQRWENAEILVAFNNDVLDQADFLSFWPRPYRPVFIRIPSGLPLGRCRNVAAEHATGEILVFFDADDIYFPNYTLDLISSLTLSRCDLVGKRSIFIFFNSVDTLALRLPQQANRHADLFNVPGGSTLCCYKRVFEHVRFSEELRQAEDLFFFRAALHHGFRIWLSDPFNHVVIRKSDKLLHTWAATDFEIITKHDVLIGSSSSIRYAET